MLPCQTIVAFSEELFFIFSYIWLSLLCRKEKTIWFSFISSSGLNYIEKKTVRGKLFYLMVVRKYVLMGNLVSSDTLTDTLTDVSFSAHFCWCMLIFTGKKSMFG